MKDSSPVESDLINIGRELSVNEARRVVALHDLCEAFLLADDPFECLTSLARELNEIEILTGKLPRFITPNSEYYLAAIQVIDKEIVTKRREFIAFNRPRTDKLKRVRAKLETIRKRMDETVAAEWRNDFARYYTRYWDRENLDLSMLGLRCRYLWLKTVSPKKLKNSKSAVFYEFCKLQKRYEILKNIESGLLGKSSEDQLILDALATMENAKIETEKLMLDSFSKPLDRLCQLFNTHFKDIYEEIFVILQHSNFTKFFDYDAYNVLLENIQKLEQLQKEIEELQDRFEKLEDEMLQADENSSMMGKGC